MKNELAVVGLVLGILAVAFFWLPGFGFLMAVAGILVSAVALGRSKALGDGRKQARAGLTLTIIALALSMFVALAFVGSWLGKLNADGFWDY